MEKTKLLKILLATKNSCTITISGVSMMPILQHGQEVTVLRQSDYIIGDILVYEYKNEGLLAHRLLKIENGRYFCKGDNSFRIEDISKEQIMGKISLEQDDHTADTFIQASYAIGRLFRKCGYNLEMTKANPQYIEYAHTYLEKTHE